MLTLFERLTAEQLPFYLRLMQHLAQRGVPVPEPHADASGQILFEVAGKPAAIVDRLHGGHQLAPDAFHCEQVGATLAQHAPGRARLPAAAAQPARAGLVAKRSCRRSCRSSTVPQADLLQSELAYQQQLAASAGYAELARPGHFGPHPR